MFNLRTFMCVLLGMVMLNCSSDDGDNNGSTGRSSSTVKGVYYGSVALSSSSLASTSLLGSDDAADCSFNLDIYAGSGACVTPLSYKGHARLITAANSSETDPDKGEVRLVGVTDSVEGKEGEIISGDEFDLGSSDSFTGYNELWFQYETQAQYDYIGAEMNYERVQFKVKDKYVTMLLVASQQPFVDASAVSDCGVSDTQKTESRYTEADVLSGMSFQRGDYLFCVKDSADETCATSDFQWIDTSSKTLVSTRPSSPRVHSFLVNDPITCSDSDYSMQGIKVAAELSTKFKLYADFSNGIDSKQWPDAKGAFGEEPDADHLLDEEFEEPYLLYYYQEDGSSTVTTGTNLSVTLNIDVSNVVYFDGLPTSSISSSSMGEVLNKTYLKHDWAFQKKADSSVVGYSINHYSAMSVTATVAVTGGTDRPDVLEID